MSDTGQKPAGTKVFYGLGTVLMIVALLYFGKPVLIPISLGVLMAFVLTPLVELLERGRLGRTLSVLIASFIAFSLIGVAGWALATQIKALAEDLPNHKVEIKHKLSSLRMTEDSTFGRLTGMFNELFPDVNPTGAENTSTDNVIVPPVVKTSPSKSISSSLEVLLPTVERLATAALVVVLVMFLLSRREDVRYRLISLMGDAELTGTTRLMRDTADRVSKYLLHLLLVNAGFGLWFGVGLYLLSVPYAALWGFLTMFLRFIPYLGSPASVFFPLLISIATSSGWSQPLWLVVFFTITELVTANAIEPILFGKTTGLTPMALLIAALFWAWIWGPIGLLLSTPLTVCLVVLGQHLPHLRSLKVLLAEQPVLDARLQYFQRLISQDAAEAHRVFEHYADEFGDERVYDEVLLPAISWTRRERLRNLITADEEKFIWNATQASITARGLQRAEAESELGIKTDASRNDFRVYCYPVHHESEEVALTMLARLIGERYDVAIGSTKQLPSKAIATIAETTPEAVILSVIPPGGLPQVAYMCAEIRKRSEFSKIVVAYFGNIDDYDMLLVEMREVGASYLTTSLSQTIHQIDMIASNGDRNRRHANQQDDDAAASDMEYEGAHVG